MDDAPVSLTPSGPPETILDPEPADVLAALEAAGVESPVVVEPR